MIVTSTAWKQMSENQRATHIYHMHKADGKRLDERPLITKDYLKFIDGKYLIER